jgi:cellulose synthase/poly-beta-1,6-N-acetylglucosamine synthase-like glycosyltransferase
VIDIDAAARPDIGTVSVVVPIADEELLLPGCLDALDAARAMLTARRPPVQCRLVLVLDGCTDGSEPFVRHRAAGDPDISVVVSHARRVGIARGLGSAHAIARAGHGPDHWLATTDADSLVPEAWLVRMLERADAGADLVLGTVRPVGALSPAIATAYEAAYRDIDGHPHVHGANLGVRADALSRLGGWPPLATGEDQALVAAAVAAGDMTVCRTAALPVATSTRLLARAPQGFSSHLRGLRAG